eukprot:jgi/Tetstr1/456018/TSEL_042794.t2
MLVVKSDGSYDDSVLFTLRAALPQLEEVQLIDVAFGAVHLITEFIPKVKKLQMQNILDECELDVRLPELENLTVHYFGGNGDAVQSMLDAATKLQAVEQRRHCLCLMIAMVASRDIGPVSTFSGGKPSEKGSTGAILLSRMVAMLSVGLGSVYSDGQDDVDGNDSSEMLTSD